MYAEARHDNARAPDSPAFSLFPSRPGEDRVLADAIEDLGFPLTVDRNREIFCEREPACYFYMLASGLVRTCRFLLDGRRHIDSFYFAGDTFGFNSGRVHGLSAEAAQTSRLVMVERQALATAAAHDGRLAMALLNRATGELRKAREHVVLLGRRNATERIVAFLQRLAGDKPDTDMLTIPMSRQDIADYLGLTIETVSRTFTQLEEAGLIELRTARSIRMRKIT